MRSLAVALAALPLFAATAVAQSAPPPSRIGPELGIGPQVANLFCKPPSCEGITAAVGANIFGSYFFSPTLGITGDLWTMYHHEDRLTFRHYVSTVGVKWRPRPIVTLTLGVGLAIAHLEIAGEIVSGPDDTEFAPAIIGAASVDVLRSRHVALSIEVRFGNGLYSDDGNDDGEADMVGRTLGLGAAFTVFGF